MLHLADSIRNEPILISHLVRIVVLRYALQTLWESLAEHGWSYNQLIELDRELAKLDFLATYHLAMREELVLFQAGFFDYLRRNQKIKEIRLLLGPEPPPNAGLIMLLCRVTPRSWLYQNQLHCAKVK